MRYEVPSGTHSILGPSSAHRWIACPGQIDLCKDIGNTVSKAAAEGTAAHYLCSECLTLNQASAIGLLGDTIVVDGMEFIVDEDMTDAVQLYLDYVNSVKTTTTTYAGVEVALDLSWIDTRLGGTADCIVFNEADGLLEVIDYKHGRGVVVEAANNTQLKIYALGALDYVWRTFYAQGAKTPQLNIRMTIVQPRAPHEDGHIRSYELPADTLLEWGRLELATSCKMVKPGAKIKPGTHCRFCPVAGGCDQYVGWVKRSAKDAFDDLPATTSDVQKKLGLMSAEDLDKLLQMSTQIRDLLNSAESFAQMMVEKGRMTLPNFKLVKRSKHRQWIDEKEAATTLGERLGDEAWKKKLVSPAQAEKLLGKGSVNDLCETPEGELILVDRGDKRPEIVGKSRTDFLDTHDLLQ